MGHSSCTKEIGEVFQLIKQIKILPGHFILFVDETLKFHVDECWLSCNFDIFLLTKC